MSRKNAPSNVQVHVVTEADGCHKECLVCSTRTGSCRPARHPCGFDNAIANRCDQPKEDARGAQEVAQLDTQLQAEGVAEIEEERAMQMAAVADGVDPKKEAARIRERHIRAAVSQVHS